MRPVGVLEGPAIAPPRSGEGRDEVQFAIAAEAGDVPEAASSEPRFGAALVLEFEEPERLDPARAAADPEPPPPPAPQTAFRLGMAASIGIHLLPLLLLVAWPLPAPETAPPIPVQLVVLKEPEPPKPPPPKLPEVKPSPGRLASVEVGDPAAPRDKPEAAAEPAPEPPKETKVAAAPPPLKPPPPTELVSALPKPAPKPQPDLKPPEPEPETLEEPRPAIKERVVARPAPKVHPTPHPGQAPGPAASRSEYLAYCMTLVQQHYALLPPSFLAGRRGRTVVNILVLEDGTIARVEVARHSGYSDIDGRIEQMIAAVRRFPPLPQWIQRARITMTYELAFPEGLLER